MFIQSSRKGVGLVDISEDLVEGTMIRRSDGVSTFQFSISNPQRKYDSIFTPNDRIVVMMKRLAWLRVYTGLLNSVPLLTAWPMVVPLTSSCSLKRLQYWYWDSNAAATQTMIRNALSAVQGAKSNTDGGITNVILTILNDVVGWPASKVHIAQIPSNWFDIAKKIAQDVDALAEESDALAAEFKQILSDKAIIAGAVPGITAGAPPSAVNGKLVKATYGDQALAGEQLTNAEIIYTVCKSLGGTDRDAVIGMMVAIDESGLRNLSYGDRDSVGVFQQRPSQGWGTVAQIMNVTYAAKSFYKQELQLGTRERATEWQVAQSVQRSGTPDGSNYKRFLSAGQAIVNALTASPTPVAPGKPGGNVGGTGASDNTPHTKAPKLVPGKSTASIFAQVGVDFVDQYPNIPYQTPGPSGLSDLVKKPPVSVDCSSFVLTIYLNTLGGAYGMKPQTNEMCRWLVAAGAKRLTAKEAFLTTGALVFMGSWPGNTTHVEISLGSGTKTVGARNKREPVGIKDWGNSNYFDFGYEVPNLFYDNQSAVTTASGSGGGGSTSAADAFSQSPPLASSLPGYNPNDPIDTLFGNNSWYPQTSETNPAMQLAEALTGIRALLNDQPLLPYLMNLFNSQMRSYCSAPNGDLIAWFPDYYGIWGTAAKMVVEPIEVQDFNVQWADDFFVTHQFTLAGKINFLDIASGDVNTNFMQDGSGAADILTQTMGIASIDIPAMMWALFGINASKGDANAFSKYIYKRFGARPAYNPMPGLQGPKAEFFSAIYMFMRQWAYQYNADIPLTFMPELYPGMLIQIPKFNFQAYVTTVTHSFNYAQGGGFQTSVNICAPARMPTKVGDHSNTLVGLPMAGDFHPGVGTSNIDPLGAGFW